MGARVCVFVYDVICYCVEIVDIYICIYIYIYICIYTVFVLLLRFVFYMEMCVVVWCCRGLLSACDVVLMVCFGRWVL